MAGRTRDNVHELEILLYDGTRLVVGGPYAEDEIARIIAAGGAQGVLFAKLKALRDAHADEIRRRYPKIPRRVSGYNLDELLPENGFHVARALVGSEGTLVTVLRAKVRLVESPPNRALVVLGYPDIFVAADAVPRINEFHPIGFEAVDDRLIHEMKAKNLHPDYLEELPEGSAFLLVEFGGATKEEADAKARRLIEGLGGAPPVPSSKIADDPVKEHDLWIVRESGLGADARGPDRPDTWEGWEDSAVPVARLGEYLRDLKSLYAKHGYEGSTYGHFGQGCVHTRITFDLLDAEGVAKFHAFLHEAAKLVVSYGGSLSGEHGDGQSKAEMLPIMFGPDIVRAFGEMKAIFDPQNKMNPHKVVAPYSPVENLRLGSEYRPARVETHFKFRDDDGDFARATLRCVGVGLCRRTEGAIMCPSYMATREEKDSTRGRAHLLFEMLQGDVIKNGWRSKEAKDALDLCLSCKGCKVDCPVSVDMATYKAEFLSHYYEGRLRPRSAYAVGNIAVAARIGSRIPRLANFATQTPGVRAVVKWAGGFAQARTLPRFAPESFHRSFARRHVSANPEGADVVLWPDTFNDHFHPETAWAAVAVLEAAGFRVKLPARPVCCGRPLYDYGWLERAKRLLVRDLAVLRDDIAAGTPIVGLEPSCVAVFRDEMLGLLPDDQDARRLAAQTFMLSEFLAKHAPGWNPPKLKGRALVQGHCHHRSVMGFADEQRVLAAIGLDAEVAEVTCCGMAGGFGFEATHYDTAMEVGELGILPKVRAAAADTLLIADGFSCRTQIEQAIGRRPLHLAEVIQLALKGTSEPAAEREPAAPGASVMSRRQREGTG
ncbi:MAG: FAD-binding and (Fe-S)-binding domain-containing protein [Thermoplasmatota archaeon]